MRLGFLDAAVVRGTRPARFLLQKGALEAIDWRMESLQRLPRLLGAADPMRYAQLLPGIQTNNDFSSGLFIHGCDNTHNWTALDGAPVFNAAHLLGLFSVFNPLHFDRMRLEKSAHAAAFPNRLGGKVEMLTPDSLPPRVAGNLEVGLISSQAALSLPLGPALGLKFSARASYLNMLYGNLLHIDDARLRYGFQDGNVLLLWRPTSADEVKVNAYWGGDQLRIDEESFFSGNSLRWQNLVLSALWKRSFGANTFVQQLSHSSYWGKLRLASGASAFRLRTSVAETSWQGRLSGRWGKSAHWEAGASYRARRIEPVAHEVQGFNASAVVQDEPSLSHEAELYFQFEHRFSSRWEGHAGLHGTAYFTGRTRRFALDPRAGLSWQCSPSVQVGLHYGLYHQYLHQVGYGSIGLPVDFFFPADAGLPPQYAHSWSLALRKELAGGYVFRLEGYYKLLRHQVDFTGNLLNLFYGSYDWRESLSSGRGKSYGLEVFVEKTSGRFQGWIGYTLGWSLRKYPESGSDRYFSSPNERRHDFNMLASYRIGRRLTLSANFVFASGTPYTRLESAYIYGQNIVGEYGLPNAARLPDYHRLDLAADVLLSRRGQTEQRLNVSLYNAYAARNVLYAYISVRQNSFRYKYMNSLCRLLPSVSYHLKF